MHSSRMHTAGSSSRLRGVTPGTPPPPQEQAPPRSSPPRISPWEQAPPSPPKQVPPRSRHPLPPVNRMTDRCKNITLPQTSFAGSKKHIKWQLGNIALIQVLQKLILYGHLIDPRAVGQRGNQPLNKRERERRTRNFCWKEKKRRPSKSLKSSSTVSG